MKASLMLGVNPNSKREENDFYATDPNAIFKAKDFFKEINLSNNVWECACGTGHLSKALQKLGYNVKSSDVIDRGYGETIDFLKYNQNWEGDILTNPPFKLASEFIQHSMNILKDEALAVFFLKVQFLETKKRANLFSNCGLKYVCINSERVCCAKDGEFDQYFKKDENGVYKGGTQLYCWFVFQKGFSGDAIIKFI